MIPLAVIALTFVGAASESSRAEDPDRLTVAVDALVQSYIDAEIVNGIVL